MPQPCGEWNLGRSRVQLEKGSAGTQRWGNRGFGGSSISVNYHSLFCWSPQRLHSSLWLHSKPRTQWSAAWFLFLKSSISFHRNPALTADHCRLLHGPHTPSLLASLGRSGYLRGCREKDHFLAGVVWEATASAFLLTCHKWKRSEKREKRNCRGGKDIKRVDMCKMFQPSQLESQIDEIKSINWSETI